MAKQDAIEQLREILPPGSAVNTRLRHVSRSGMTRDIQVLTTDGSDITSLVAAALEARVVNRGVRVGGIGMDMGFHLVYRLGRTLWRGEFFCAGKRKSCPSNDHINDYRRLALKFDAKHEWPGDTASLEERSAYVSARNEYIASVRTYRTDRKHSDAGYALRHNWLWD